MIRTMPARLLKVLVLAALPASALADEDRAMPATVGQVSTHMGEMAVDVEAADVEVDDALRFEPYQQFEEMFFRDDVVWVMRHGPTDWSKLDAKDVAPGDCDDQRVMVEEGIARMRDLGILLASNDVVPSRIVTSEWCRNQQTLDALMDGFAAVDPAIAEAMPMETDGGLNLLLSLQGSRDVEALRAHVESWDGEPERDGPLLVITHYTNIEELTQFRVFEGEILVLDPDRDNQVLGYVRLASASPDVGHFADALASPLVEDEVALDMVTRYYDALNASDEAMLLDVLDERWVLHGASPSLPERDTDGLVAELARITAGLEGVRFEVSSLHVADGAVTVLGTIRGRHTPASCSACPRPAGRSSSAPSRCTASRTAPSWRCGRWPTARP